MLNSRAEKSPGVEGVAQVRFRADKAERSSTPSSLGSEGQEALEDVGTLWAGVEGLGEEAAGPRKAGTDSGSTMLRFQAGAKGSIQEREGKRVGPRSVSEACLAWDPTARAVQGLCRGCAAAGGKDRKEFVFLETKNRKTEVLPAQRISTLLIIKSGTMIQGVLQMGRGPLVGKGELSVDSHRENSSAASSQPGMRRAGPFRKK